MDPRHLLTKHVNAPLTFKAEADEGTVVARFSVFNEVDSDGDVVLPSTFTPGQEVAMAAWGHNWHSLPFGKGAIQIQPDSALFEGRFFVDTTHGLDAYRTVKNMGSTQEWSWGFRVLDAEPGEMNGQPVRFIKRAEVFEVSPVLIGANRNTETLFIKGNASTYADHGSRVLADLEAFLSRSRDLSDLRAKEGRVLSAANRQKLKTLLDALAALDAVREEIESLLEASDPQKAAKEAADELARSLRMSARLRSQFSELATTGA